VKIDWSKLTPSQFETFCAAILEENGFTNILWHGAFGGDRGRDLTASKEIDHLPSLTEYANWVVQCRRYTTKPPGKSEIHDWLVSCNEHKPSHCLLVVTNTLSSDTKDWLTREKEEFRFKIFVWEELDLVREIVKHKRVLSSRFPELYQPGLVVEFHRANTGEYEFICQEFEEVSFLAINCGDESEAKAKIRDFVEFLKEHDPVLD
jgi:hypothetical protein